MKLSKRTKNQKGILILNKCFECSNLINKIFKNNLSNQNIIKQIAVDLKNIICLIFKMVIVVALDILFK